MCRSCSGEHRLVGSDLSAVADAILAVDQSSG
jgi:hypothetical protein